MIRKVNRFEAHLDDYDTITVYLANAYYQGKSRVFYLRDKEGHLSELEIRHFATTSNDYVKYNLGGFEELEIGKEYDILEEHAMATPLQYGYIVRTERFDKEFYSDRNDFGAKILGDTTRFTVWSPTTNQMKLNLWVDEKEYLIDMKREEHGVYTCTLVGNFHGAQYLFTGRLNGRVFQTIDPYGVSSTVNNQRSVVVDFKQLAIEMHDDKLPKLKHKTDVMICETSVRDFSYDEFANITHRSKYLGLVEEGTKDEFGNPTGFDFLKSLGFTHIQLMPVFDFETVDELNPQVFYNWGYDPVQYNSLEGSYSSDPTDPMLRIKEFKTVVSKMHEAGLRVTLDVVYNHVFDIERSSFEQLVPGYFFRRSTEGALSNGSFCGNDFDSGRRMARKFIVDSILHYIEHYHVDGFRFDLMGILDVETMNTIVLESSRARPQTLIYGEGWNMPTLLEEEDKASMYNFNKMPEVIFFNDFYRDHTKGASDESRAWHKGYLTGDTGMIEAAKACLVGTTQQSQVVKLFDEPTQSVNYVECHDNWTLWDKIKEACRDDLKVERIARQKAINGFLCVSQGVLFMQYGQESCRTKGGINNSYRSPDEINRIDYSRHIQYREVVEYTKDLLSLRKDYPIFRFNHASEIEEHVYFENLENEVLLYGFQQVSQYCEFEEVKVFINPNKFEKTFDLQDDYEILADESGRVRDQRSSMIQVKPLSMMIVAR